METYDEMKEKFKLEQMASLQNVYKKAQTKHTPGPWKYSEGGSKPYHSQIYFEGAYKEEYVGEVLTKNARLIATAPELLNVCKELLEAFIENQNDLNEIPISQAMILLKKVIKKAEGT